MTVMGYNEEGNYEIPIQISGSISGRDNFYAGVLLFRLIRFSSCSRQYGTWILPEKDAKKINATARRFVARLAKTRDIAPLIGEFFAKDYVPFLDNAYESSVSTELFSKLSTSEKRRLFIATYNMMYFDSVLFMSEPDSLRCYNELPECKEKTRQSLYRIFPKPVVARMEQLERSHPKARNRTDVLKIISEKEYILRIARPALIRKNLEKIPEFRAEYAEWEKKPHFNFQIDSWIQDDVIKGRNGKNIVEKGERIFGITTPHFISLILVKQGNYFKIIDLAVPSDD